MRRRLGRLAACWAMSMAVALAVIGMSAAPVAAAPAAAEPAPAPVPALPGAPTCGPSPAAPDQPTGGRSQPPPAPRYLPADFPAFPDASWGFPVGGIGGRNRRSALTHTPVVFVHGNQADAQNWLSVMQQFQNLAGYDLQDMYAVSYNGLGNFYAGAPDTSPPTAADQAYVSQNQAGLANGGHGAADDDEVPDLCRFIEAVQWYTGSRQVDIVTHSLGVTIVRRLMQLYPSLARDVVAFVGIAGGNHGTSVCRGLDKSYYGCNEIAPGTPWLDALNGPDGRDETYAPTAWMTVSNGSAGDPFFDPPFDTGSPVLRGADNRTFAGAYHNDLRVGSAEVDTYLAFLLRHGQAGPGAARDGAERAAAIEAAMPDGRTGGDLCVPGLTGPANGCPARAAHTVDGATSDPPAGAGVRAASAAAPVRPLISPPAAAPLPATGGRGETGLVLLLLAAGFVLREAVRRTRAAGGN